MNGEIMNESDGIMNKRRDVLTALGAGALAALAAAPALATDAKDSRKDNVDHEAKLVAFVTAFCNAWSTKDVEALIPFLAPEIEYHMFEGAPPIKGHDQFRERLKGFMAGQKEIKWDISRSFAVGDVVLNERIDHFIQPDGSLKPSNHFHVAGVFLVRDRKISYWKDYNMPKAND
ncbi:MAG: nuclear transport factor 2 family protein [Rhodospirillaceae bacterium]|nr:nuclear transport factor 2 family protein [Rhodospirillaceae bacterium]